MREDSGIRRTRAVQRSALVAAFVAVGMVLMAGSALAWCSPFVDKSTTLALSRSQGAAGTYVTVTGVNWADGPVIARWVSPSGEIELGEATVPTSLRFSMTVQIPATASGTGTILVFHRGSIESQRTATFVVASDADLAGDSGTATDGGGATNGKVNAAPAAGETGIIPGSGMMPTGSENAFPAPSPTATAGTPTPAQRAAGTRPLMSQGPASTPSATPDTATPGVPPPSASSALSDLWSGFATGGSSPAPSLGGPSSPDPTSGSGTATALTVFGLGLAALFAGFGIAEVSRRRATASVR